MPSCKGEWVLLCYNDFCELGFRSSQNLHSKQFRLSFCFTTFRSSRCKLSVLLFYLLLVLVSAFRLSCSNFLTQNVFGWFSFPVQFVILWHCYMYRGIYVSYLTFFKSYRRETFWTSVCLVLIGQNFASKNQYWGQACCLISQSVLMMYFDARRLNLFPKKFRCMHCFFACWLAMASVEYRPGVGRRRGYWRELTPDGAVAPNIAVAIAA